MKFNARRFTTSLASVLVSRTGAGSASANSGTGSAGANSGTGSAGTGSKTNYTDLGSSSKLPIIV